jgi:hypothetical protein
VREREAREGEARERGERERRERREREAREGEARDRGERERERESTGYEPFDLEAPVRLVAVITLNFRYEWATKA